MVTQIRETVLEPGKSGAASLRLKAPFVRF